MIIQIFIGIIALGFVVFVHELGHFIAAQILGIEVVSFSIGWGPVIFKHKIGQTEYRISAFPLGGYCGMKGDNAIKDALDKGNDYIEQEEGSFYASHPIKRIIIAFSGPFANLLFALLVFSFASTFNTSYSTYSNRIILAQLNAEFDSPAAKAGLQDGDYIYSIDNQIIHTFYDLQKAVSSLPGKTKEIQFIRDDLKYTTTIDIELDKKTGSGKIGVYPFIPPIVDSVDSNIQSTLIPKDEILQINNIPIWHALEIESYLSSNPKNIILTIKRNNSILEVPFVIHYGASDSINLGFTWEVIMVTETGSKSLEVLKTGFSNTIETIKLTFTSLGVLFKGIDLTNAVSGPVRITLLIGEVATSSFVNVLNLLGIICISLFLMNLLPIPILDGGVILISFLEMILTKPLKPKTLYYIQFIGVFFVLLLLFIAIVGDINFLTTK